MPRRSALGILFLTVFLDLLGFGLVIPLVQKYVEYYWLQDSPDSPWVGRIATALSACFSLAQFVAAPLWGSLSDRIGRRPVLLATIPLTGLAYLLFGLASDESLNHHVLPNGHAVVVALFVTRILGGAFAANISTAFAYVSDVTTPESRSRGLGVLGAAFGLGFVFGPAIGGWLFGTFGRGAPGYAAAALALVNTVWAFARLEESLPPERRGRAPARIGGRLAFLRASIATPELGRLLLLFFLATFAFAHMEQALALFLGAPAGDGGRAWDEERIGYYFAFLGIGVAVTQGGLLRPLSRKFSEAALVRSGWALLALGLAGLGMTGAAGHPLALLGLAGLVVAVGNGLGSPSLNALISRAAPETAQGGTFGASQSMGSLARIVGPLSAGWCMDYFGRASPMYVAAGVTVVALVLFRAAPSGTSDSPRGSHSE